MLDVRLDIMLHLSQEACPTLRRSYDSLPAKTIGSFGSAHVYPEISKY